MPKPFNRWGFPQFVLFTLAFCCDINTGKRKALCQPIHAGNFTGSR
jgi:hypothetical protein